MLLEHLAHAERDLAHLREGHARLRVEIDAQLVGAVEVLASHRPGVPVDHAEVHAPHEVGRVVGHELARVAAAREGHGRRLQPPRRAVGDALLEEGLALHAVHPALHHRGPLAQPAHHRLLALHVVLDEIELRDARRRGSRACPGCSPAPPGRSPRSSRARPWPPPAGRMPDRERPHRRDPPAPAARLRAVRPAARRRRGRRCARRRPARWAARADADVLCIDPQSTPASLADALQAERFDERMRAARAVVLAVAGCASPRSRESAAFEIATRARQSGVPCYAVTALERARLIRPAHPRPAGRARRAGRQDPARRRQEAGRAALGPQRWQPGHQKVTRLFSHCPRWRILVPQRGQGRSAWR